MVNLSDVGCDFSITHQNGTITAHKWMLAAKSTFFGNYAPDNINCPQYNGPAIRAFIQYCYDMGIGSNTTPHIASQLLQLAVEWQVNGLKEAVEAAVNVNFVAHQLADLDL